MQAGDDPNDPILKAALRRLYADHTASAALRRSVGSLLAPPMPRRIDWRSRPLRAGLIAATLVLAAVGLHLWRSHRDIVRARHAVFVAMVQAHEHSGELSPTIAQTPATPNAPESCHVPPEFDWGDPAPLGWTLVSADRVFDSTINLTRRVYRRDGRRATALVMPPGTAEHFDDGTRFDETVEGHLIRGEVVHGWAICVVADEATPRTELDALLRSLARR
jgi:hypothetical protein